MKAAAFPFGMVQPGADTGRSGWDHCAGYLYSDTSIVGFSQTHLNGTGSADLGDLSLFPFTGERPAKFESKFSHVRETASPGYYAVTLDDFGVRAEATCSRRVAYYRFTAAKPIRLFVDPTSTMNGGANDPQTRVVACELNVEGQSRLSGFVAKKGWIARKLWFVVESDRPLKFADGVWEGADSELEVRVAVSASSVEGAKRNLASERGAWDFDRIRADARKAWRGCIERVAIPEGTSDTAKRNLATAVYRLCLQPNLLSDDGEPPFYTTFSLWDTYRAAHPLYCELFPEMVPHIVNSLLEQGRRTGYLPVWALWGRETDWMIGTHSIPVIADAFLRGFGGVDWEAAYAQVRDTLTDCHGRSKVDWGLIDRYGYYPCDMVKSESMSRLLEDAFDCWCAGRMAEKLGRAYDVTGLIGQYAHGNEPSHHIPWLYALCGRPDKAKAIVGEIMEKFYRPAPDGLCGNDDCGQMSAWYIWAFLGRYPVTPCGGDFGIIRLR